MRKFKGLSLLLLASSFVFVSCTKEGPEGPAGATGPQGPGGTPGAPGTPGAGVTTYSPWFTPAEADWADATAAPYYGALMYKKAAPGVTQAIMDNGVVLAYMKNWTYFDDATGDPLKEPNKIVQLPYTADIFFLDVYDFAIPAVGNLDFVYKSQAAWDAASIAGTSFRYILIPGSVAGGRAPNGAATYEGYTKDQLQKMTYDQVAEIFNIPATGSNIK